MEAPFLCNRHGNRPSKNLQTILLMLLCKKTKRYEGRHFILDER